MKSAIAIAAAALVSFGIAAPASAYHLTPENSSFTGNGKTSATKSGVTLPCKAKLEGTIDGSGVGSVSGAYLKAQIPAYLNVITEGSVQVPFRTFPLSDVSTAWVSSAGSGPRVVIVPG